MNPEIAALLARRLAAPKQFEVVTLFADGSSRKFETETRAQAENYAVGEKRKVGRILKSRETDAEVRVVDVYVAAI